jgi:3-oxoadipate enol-lactonase
MPKVKSKDGITLNYDIHDYTDPWKDAPILVLQHGNGRSSRFWFSLLPYLTRNFKVVCPDLRGLGLSSADFDLERGITRENYISDLLCILDDLGASTVHYAGESLGGIIGLMAAALHPERIRTLCVMSSPPYQLHDTSTALSFGYSSAAEALAKMGVAAWSKGVNSANRFPPDTDTGLQEWYAAEMGKNKVESLIATQRVLGNAEARDTRPFLPRIKAPVLGLYSSGAPTVTPEMERVMLDLVPTMRIVHVPVKGHMIWMVEPAACAAHMLHFMSLHDGTFCHQ